MAKEPVIIPIGQLALMLIPMLFVGGVLAVWSKDYFKLPIATSRMILQLVGIGFFLSFIFTSKSALFISGLVGIMLLLAAWIAFSQSKKDPAVRFTNIGLALVLGCLPTLVLVVNGILQVGPWRVPQVIIPLAGMIFANGMTTLSIAVERFGSDHAAGADWLTARSSAVHASLIPITNAFLSVGLVSLPGMMTGQILSGVDPLIAVRYQMMVMGMVFSASGLSVICYFYFLSKQRIK